MKTKLLNDVARCHDSGCDEKENCLSWLDRKAKGENVNHCASLFPYDIPIGDKCPNIIKSK